MTTIAWDGQTLAVDSQETTGGVINSRKFKKLYLDIGGYDAIAFCGATGEVLSYIEWLKNPGETEKPKGDFGGIGIRGKKAYQIYGNTSVVSEISAPITDGSGFAIALGALHAGKNAIEAIKITKKLDIYTGGKIQSYTVK